MPPRSSSRPFTQALPQQSCLRVQLQHDFISSQHRRGFHATPCPSERTRPQTRLRRDMYAWLSGPGKALRDPLPSSSNYLSAYDRQGNLNRLKERRERAGDAASAEEAEENEEGIQTRELAEGVSEEEVGMRADRRKMQRLEQRDLDQRDGIPPERISDLRPYPLNRDFVSQRVLSEELRQKIYELVVREGLDIKSVSAAYSVDIRRVAAVVRLMSIEKKWISEGKPLAEPYNKAVLAMLPQTQHRPELRTPPRHEEINDLPVHPSTRQQLFLPAAESAHFTRADAAKAFNPNLLPADQRIAHPELIQIEKWVLEGHDRETRQKLQRDADAKAAIKSQEKERKKREWEERTQRVVAGKRWDFKFEDVSAEKVGKDGRSRGAMGLRYGMPHEERKRGMVKIPKSVE